MAALATADSGGAAAAAQADGEAAGGGGTAAMAMQIDGEAAGNGDAATVAMHVAMQIDNVAMQVDDVAHDGGEGSSSAHGGGGGAAAGNGAGGRCDTGSRGAASTRCPGRRPGWMDRVIKCVVNPRKRKEKMRTPIIEIGAVAFSMTAYHLGGDDVTTTPRPHTETTRQFTTLYCNR